MTSKKPPEDTSTLPYTHSRFWQVQNYTRYRTEDLIALCNAVEWAHMGLRKAAGDKNSVLQRERAYGIHVSAPHILTFDHYAKTLNPKNRYGRPEKNESFVKPGWRGPEVRISSPEEIGLTPLEMLALPTDDWGTAVPPDQTLQLAKTLATFYSTLSPGENRSYAGDKAARVAGFLVEQKQLPVLRFGNKAKKKPVKESGDPRLRRISRDRVKEASHAADFIARNFQDLHERIEAANAYATKRGVAPYIDPAVAKYLEGQVRTYLSTITDTLNTLQESLQEKP